jgi:hypothetical protein
MPQQWFYRRAIRVVAVEGVAVGSARDLGDKPAQTFFKLVHEELRRLEKLATGRDLISALDLTGKTVTVFAAEAGQDSVTKANPEGIDAEVRCSVRPFRPRHKNLPVAMRGDDPKKSAVVKDYRKVLGTIGENQKKAQLAGELDLILQRAKCTRATLSQLIGRSRTEVDAMAQGTLAIDDDTYYRICFYFYDFLTPGPGIDTVIRLEPVEELLADKNSGTFSPKKNHNDVPGYIVLGHELIHAWRMMAGRRIVRQGWEEEAMTSGISIFMNYKFTENRLRKEAGLPLRPSYANNHISSPFADSLRAGQMPV